MMLKKAGGLKITEVNMKTDKNCLELIEELSMAKGPSGFEDEVLEVVRRRAGDFCHINEDCLRNLYLYPK